MAHNVHNVLYNLHTAQCNIDSSTKSSGSSDIDGLILINDIQDKYTASEVKKLNTKFPIAAQEGEDDYDEYMDMTVNIQKMRGDIVNFSQKLNYVLPHATKPSEAHSIIRRVMRQSNGFESWRQLQLHFAGDTELDNFLFYAQSRSLVGIATLDNSPSSTTSG
eukprot:6463531-Amphidinium_carterae.1